MAIPLATVAEFLTASGITAPVNINWLPATPDEIVVVTGSGGATVSIDGAFETAHVHIQCRAATDAAAETLALQVHRVLAPLTTQGSVQMGATHVLSAAPMAPPSFLMRDQEDRTTYLGTYLLDVTA